MVTRTTPTFTFPQFSQLPAELRNQIWADSLPEKDDPLLYLYRKGYWAPGNPERTESNLLTFGFDHTLLHPVRVKSPLLSVNREARGVAFNWMHKHGIEQHFCQNTQCHIFVRAFDPTQDALCYTSGTDIIDGPHERMREIDYQDFFEYHGRRREVADIRHFRAAYEENNLHFQNDVTRVAVEGEILDEEGDDTLMDLFKFFPKLELICVIDDDDMDELWEMMETKVQRRVEYTAAYRSFFWNHEKGDFDLGDCQDVGNESMYWRMDIARKELRDTLIQERIPSFEIRPILAILK